MKRLAIIFILSFLLLASSTASVVAQNTATKESKTYIILYDQAHNQFFTKDKMSTALSSLNDSLDTAKLDVTVHIVVQHDRFNSSNLQGVDLVMITNPGQGNQTDTHLQEQEALTNLYDAGGSVMWLSNPVSHNQNITGHASVMNQLIDGSRFGATVTTGQTDVDNTTIIMDQFHNFNGNTSYVRLNSDNFSNDTMVTEVNNVTKANNADFLYYGTSVDIKGAVREAGNVSSTAYVMNKDFVISKYQISPPANWYYGQENTNGNDGRVLLVGSTIMFSDYHATDSMAFVNHASNLQLFQNMVAWSLGITPLPQDQSIVKEPFNPFFVTTNVAAATILGVSLLVFTTILFVREGRLSGSKIFDFINKKSAKDSDSSSGKGSSSKQKKPSKKSRRRRRI